MYLQPLPVDDLRNISQPHWLKRSIQRESSKPFPIYLRKQSTCHPTRTLASCHILSFCCPFSNTFFQRHQVKALAPNTTPRGGQKSILIRRLQLQSQITIRLVWKSLQLRNRVWKNGNRTGRLNDKGFFTPEIIKLLSYCMCVYIYIYI